MSVTADTKLIYDFDEGSRDMRELLGGKGAGVAEMTRVLGADRVPRRLGSTPAAGDGEGTPADASATEAA